MREAGGKAGAGRSPAGRAVGVLKDRRAHPRVRHELPVDLFEGAGEDCLSFETEDICPGGVFVRSDLLLEPEKLVTISMRLPDAGLALRSLARVAWVNREPEPGYTYRRPGMGMQFHDLSDTEKAALQAWLYIE